MQKAKRQGKIKKIKKQALILRDSFYFLVVFFIFSFLLLPFSEAQAQQQDSFALSITPALFQVSLQPGEVWTSQLKVINTNDFDATYHASVVNFRAANERGQPRFEPIVEEDIEGRDATLAHWINITEQPIKLEAGQSRNIPFNIEVPDPAPPGGHYAAILIGTKPAEFTGEGAITGVSSFVSSLLFVRISGDVTEQGIVREFSTDSGFYQEPKADFNIRFQNEGNVHLRPQGEIKIFNMWGKERGTVAINQFSGFGNVLPGTTRTFSFTWEGEPNIFDIGKYSAELTLNFGEQAAHSIDSDLSFWVVPLKSTLGMLGGLAAFILVIVFAIRWYIRRAFRLQAAALGITPEMLAKQQARAGEMTNDKVSARHSRQPSITNEIQSSNDKIKDTKEKPETKRLNVKSQMSKVSPRLSLKKKYGLLVVSMLVLTAVLTSVFYFRANLIPEREFEIIIEKQGSSTGVQVE